MRRLENETEAAYRRGTLFNKRRKLIADWAKYCAQPPRNATVSPIRGAAS